LHNVGGTDPVSALFGFDRQVAGLFQNIKAGQLVSATIVKQTQQGYLVNVAGKNLLLQTSAALETGQEVRAEFVQHEGAWQLRLANADARPHPTPAAANANLDQEASTLLAQLGLETTSENSLAASALIQAGLPASRALLESLALLLSDKTTLQTALVHLTELLRNVLPRFSDPDLTSQLRALLVALESTLAAPPESELATRLQSFLANSGILMESRLKSLLQPGSGANGRPAINNDLKFTLLRLRSLLDTRAQEFRSLLGANGLRDFEVCLSNALKLVRGQQILNIIHAGVNQMALQIPFLGAWGFENVRLHFFCERDASGNRSLSYAVTVDMNTTNLGRLRAVLRWHRKTLYCHFIAEREPVAELVRAELAGLKERLEAGNFSVGDITCSVAAWEETPPYDTSWPLMRTVDVKG
jgi:hypothetical protein